MQQNDTILFFDGVCGLCNGLVDWLLPKDTRARLKYATLQGSTAKAILPAELLNLETVVVWHHGRILTKSDAVFACVSELGGFWKMVGVFRLIPKSLRDGLYSLVARRRYKWFGQRHTCRMPLPGERLRFLD
jgi:predicted DCC family thiol-disulfide oxidoreductase YuxK